ncbi:unnamed protein product [Durusdinium trenchii]|uniref:C3H1-type domain-containing protein n=1 Tax=Durusdinium trenchii TaxID=1381693 RepID=A0ABP0P6Q3_9DINO
MSLALQVIKLLEAEGLTGAQWLDQTPKEEAMPLEPQWINVKETQVFPEASAGGLGHPEFCARPCVYFSKGMCRNGAECEYCHLPHVSNPKLDKRQRTMVQGMPKFDLLTLVHGALQLRAQRLKKKNEEFIIEELLVLLQKEISALSLQDAVMSTSKHDLQLVTKLLSKSSISGIVANLVQLPDLYEKMEKEISYFKLRRYTGL